MICRTPDFKTTIFRTRCVSIAHTYAWLVSLCEQMQEVALYQVALWAGGVFRRIARSHGPTLQKSQMRPLVPLIPLAPPGSPRVSKKAPRRHWVPLAHLVPIRQGRVAKMFNFVCYCLLAHRSYSLETLYRLSYHLIV